MAIDAALAQKPADLDALAQLLRYAGIEVARRGKALRLRAPGWKRFAEVDSLGDGYSEKELLAVLGLYLAREIVTRQGGYIKVVSEPGKGSEFSIMLPTK